MRRRAAVDTHDLSAFRRATIRARVLRAVLAAAALASLGFAAASARGADVRVRSILPSGSTGVVVLDLSLSIQDTDYRRLRSALRHLIAADAPIGLIVFSDAPYELLPPGTPARELRPIIRLLTPPERGQPVNPWSDAFRAGTRISAALLLAREMLARDRVRNGSILLLSDLETAPEDLDALLRVLGDLRADSIPVRIVPLSAGREALQNVRSVLGEAALAAPEAFEGEPGRPVRIAGGGALPGLLIALGAFCLAALGAHERLAGRLAVPWAGGAA
jgi:von Willebrand factor type A domain